MNVHGVPAPLSRDSAYLVAGLVGLGLAQAASLIGVALIIQSVASSVIGGAEARIDPVLVSALILLSLAGPLARWRERINAERLGNRYVHRVRLVLFDALTRGRQTGGIRTRQRGVQMVRFSSDLSAIRQWVSLGLSRLISTVLFLGGVLVAISLIDLRMAGLVGAILLVALAATLGIGIGFERSVRTARRRRGRIANSVADSLGSTAILEAFGRTGRERRRLARLSAELGRALLARGFWMGMLRAFTDFAHRTIMISVLLAGALLVASGTLSVGGLLAAIGVAAMLGGPLRDLGRVFEYWKSAQVATEKLNQTIDARPVDRVSKKRLREGDGRVSVDGLAVDGLFQGGTFSCAAGDRVAITGTNGSGKTTLLRIIAGLGGRDDGRARLDGVDTRRLSPADRREAIGMAASHLALVSGSISKNIRYRRPSADEADVLRAAQDAGLEDVVQRLEKGFATRVGPSAEGLSTGQAGRVKLARALIGQPRLLLLDEIESGLDGDGRSALVDLLLNYPGTVIYATHDDHLVTYADRIWHIGNGSVRETHLSTPEPMRLQA